jgi:hypothetical protein
MDHYVGIHVTNRLALVYIVEENAADVDIPMEVCVVTMKVQITAIINV